MTGTPPSVNDSAYALWKKIANSLYATTQNAGLAGVNPPGVNDTEFDVKKRVAYYLALLDDYANP